MPHRVAHPNHAADAKLGREESDTMIFVGQ
jgi:hypothetical protein